MPLKLVTGTIFMGGAFFVFGVIRLSDTSIREIQGKSLALEREITERNSREQEKSRYQAGMELLDRLSRRLISTAADREAFLETLCRGLQELVAADLALVPLRDSGPTFTYQAAWGLHADKIRHRTIPVDDGGLCGWVFQTGDILCIPDLRRDCRVKQELAAQLGVVTGLVAPLFLADEVVGGLSAFRRERAFDQIDADCFWISTASRRSTTPWVMPSATWFCAKSPAGSASPCGNRTPWPAWGATSSSWFWSSSSRPRT